METYITAFKNHTLYIEENIEKQKYRLHKALREKPCVISDLQKCFDSRRTKKVFLKAHPWLKIVEEKKATPAIYYYN